MIAKTGQALWEELAVSLVTRFMASEAEPYVWIVGDEWLRHANGQWWIGADESATKEQVQELLVEAGAAPIIWLPQ